MNRNSLRSRMTFGFALSFAIFAVVASLGFLIWSRELALIDATERSRAAALLLDQEWNGRTDEDSILHTFDETYEDARLENVALLILDPRGREVGSEGHPPLPGVRSHPGWVIQSVQSSHGTVAAGVHWEPIEKSLQARTFSLLGSALLASLGMGVAAWFLVGRTLRPIGELTDQAKAASADALHAHLATPSGDTEVTRLVATLNDFLDRLKDNAKDREQFYASAAHELRTPLAVLSANIEIALSRPRENTEYQETLSELQDQTRLLTKLAEDLLTLNRLNTSDSDGDEEREPVDLADICERMLRSLAPRIEERGLVVKTDFDHAKEVFTSSAHTTILVRNLIENAVKYTPPGGWIRISIHEMIKVTRLEVANEYPDVDQLDFVHLFDPFY
ncbi:HAMP domain-containing histidine kinase, partial [bacterium]